MTNDKITLSIFKIEHMSNFNNKYYSIIDNKLVEIFSFHADSGTLELKENPFLKLEIHNLQLLLWLILNL